MPRGQQAVVRAIFQSNAAREVDHTRIYVSADMVSRLTRDARPSSIDIVMASPLQASELAETLRGVLPAKVDIRTWKDLNRGLVDTMRLESMGSFIVLALIVLVASFNVLVSLTLGVVEKRRDIAVLLTIGIAAEGHTPHLFVQGLTLGGVAVALGVATGLFVSWGQITFQWITFDMSAGYLVPALPDGDPSRGCCPDGRCWAGARGDGGDLSCYPRLTNASLPTRSVLSDTSNRVIRAIVRYEQSSDTSNRVIRAIERFEQSSDTSI